MSATPPTMPECGTVSVDGAQLEYVVEGRGYPCLVVGSSTLYRRTFPQPLKALLRCAFMDHRGFLPGATTGAQEQYTIDLITDDIEQVRRALGWERVVVYGHSIQGLMALEYAHHYPEQVSHVVMEVTPPYWGEAFEQARHASWDSAASPERKALLEHNRQGLEERLQGMSDAEMIVANLVADGPRLWADPTYDASWLWDGVGINVALTNQIFGSTFGGYDGAPIGHGGYFRTGHSTDFLAVVACIRGACVPFSMPMPIPLWHGPRVQEADWAPHVLPSNSAHWFW